MDSKVEYNVSANENKVNLMNKNQRDAPTSNGEGTSSERLPPRQKRGFPIMFERCSKKWWNPQMDTAVLENQCHEFIYENSRCYFQLALSFIITSCLSWIIYFGARQKPSGWVAGMICSAILIGICLIIFLITKLTNWFKRFAKYIALALITVLIVTVILANFFSADIVSSAGSFFLVAETILILYVIMPLPLYISFILGFSFSILYEVVYHLKHTTSAGEIIAHILLHICLHIIGIQTNLNMEIRRRSTFWKVGHLVTSNLSAQFKKVMIDSIMPKTISEKLLDGENLFKTNEGSTFRPLYVSRMENVSILYADIVGFTKMSANKTAAELVYLLNDLFRRFDNLCLNTGCEKISTLGDCYYCVSGCPDPRDDHARCCVEMGFGMIAAIKNFCQENKVNVDMRIGIHTGIVICGIIGTKRFKFDVWSNDVSFANQMEQWGVPGRIHVSEATKLCLDKFSDEYELEDGKIEERAPKDVVESKKLKTFLVSKRIRHDSDSSSVSGESVVSQNNDNTSRKVKTENEHRQTKTNGVKSDDSQKKDGEEGQGAPAVTGETAHENPSVERVASHPRPSTRRHHSSRHHSKRPVPLAPKQDKIYELIGLRGIMPFLDSKVREKQDAEFISSIKENPRMRGIHETPLLHPVSLNFYDQKIELAYRKNFLDSTAKNEPISSFVDARFSLYVDILVTGVIFLLVFFAGIAILGSSLENPSWLITFFFFLLLMICISGAYLFNYQSASDSLKKIIEWFSSWIGRHFSGVLLLLSPACLAFSHMYCKVDSPFCSNYLIIFGIILIHFTNFNQLSSWMKSILALLVSLTVLLLFYVNPCSEQSSAATNTTMSLCDLGGTDFEYEFILDIFLLFILILLVNKISEEEYRIAFHSAHEADQNKNQSVDELLHHIIPPRVTEVLKDQKVYSKNHDNVAVVFASITNFNDFYEEQFAGGKECIRILNELIGDVDELLDRKEFRDIEKIKTIGSTFMIAAGLDPNIERDLDNNSHLRMLMEFCIEMQKTINAFSENMVYFTFVLRIGFNHGSVTAGVIGTTKLLYDIWGDTVNIASRMDSTGVPGRIQVSEGSMQCLKDSYDFEHRGSTFVKGKGQMETYLLKAPNTAAQKPIQAYPWYT